MKIKTEQFKAKEKWGRNKVKKFHQHDEHLVQKLTGSKKLPTLKQLSYISKYLNKTESLIIRILSGVIVVCLASLIINVYWTHSAIMPAIGGSYTEGLVGSPHYINPLYAQANDVDLDISSIVFSGLFKYSANGLEKDLISNYTISNDQKVYTFELRQDVTWHDGEKFDADDVIFSFNRITNSISKTPLYFNFQGTLFEKIDEYNVRFTLKEPFAPFLESLTVGVLPEHIWQNILPENMMLAEYNLKPIGTGPYIFASLTKNKNGEIKNFKFKRNENYYNTPAYIEDLNLKFHHSFEEAVEALNNKNVDGISYLPKEIRSRIINNRNLNFNLLQLPQYTSIFFNYSSSPVLKDLTIRKILSHAIDKEKIVNEILNAEAQMLDSCILPDSLGYNPDIVKYPFNVEHAKTELEKAGWKLSPYQTETTTTDEETEGDEVTIIEEYPFQVRKKNNRYLEFDLTTVNQTEKVTIAKQLQKEWQKIGAKVNLIIVNPTDIQTTLRTRDYQALLYGQILGHDPDPYPFWHSSQRSYPGLNLTSLQHSTIDKLLEDARKTGDETKRAEKYHAFQKIMAENVPAIFLYNPTYTYPQNKKVKGFETTRIITPANRFNQINDWYIKTDRQWVR